jgi:hypothetical protein
MNGTVRVLLVVVGIAVLSGAAYVAHGVSRMGARDFFGKMLYDQREEGDLKVGDPAPDVVLAGLDGRSVRLRDRIGGRPVVLIFGSYT